MLESYDQFAVCCEARDGLEAVQLALDSDPDVAILDITMPRMNGIEAARQIIANCPGVPIVILSMHDEFAAQINALKKAGIKGFVSKSRTDRELIRAVQAVTSGHTYFRGRQC